MQTDQTKTPLTGQLACRVHGDANPSSSVLRRARSFVVGGARGARPARAERARARVGYTYDCVCNNPPSTWRAEVRVQTLAVTAV